MAKTQIMVLLQRQMLFYVLKSYFYSSYFREVVLKLKQMCCAIVQRLR